MSHPFYADYKDSGAEWLGEVPSHWTVTRIGGLFREVVEEGEEGLPILSVSIHNGVSDKELDEKEAERKVTRSEDATTYKAVRPDDLVYNMMRAWQGAFGAVQVAGMVSPAYVVARPTKEFLTRYVELVLRTPKAVEEMRRHSQGVTDFRLRLYWDEFKTIRVALPPLAEQAAVLSFLDRETARIDSLVAEQERLIALVKEKRQAVISHAVTKGLNPTVPMKDSGIDWLGEVPEHWIVAPVGYRYEVQLGKMLDSAKVVGENLRPYLRVFDVQWGKINTDNLPLMDFYEEDRERYSLQAGDILVNEGGSYVGRSAIWRGAIENCYYQKALHRLRPTNPSCDFSEFFYYVMYFATHLGVFVAGGRQATIEHLTAEALRRYRFAFPPFPEQVAIVTYLEDETSKLDALVAEAERAIDLLREHRAALISAAVTGKIDVRGLVDMEAA